MIHNNCAYIFIITARRLGDLVFGNAAGTLAEYISVHIDDVVKKPTNVSHTIAASLPTAGLMAYQALHYHGLKAHTRVLVIGASGRFTAINFNVFIFLIIIFPY